MSGAVAWMSFVLLASAAIGGSFAMVVTMSMYRAALCLMASFVAVAGLFILLGADLLAAIQVMMNVGGMLVMLLFMVMLMMDPGGEMMWDMMRQMHMRGWGALAMVMPPGGTDRPADGAALAAGGEGDTGGDYTCPMHPEVRAEGPGKCPKCGMDLVPAQATEEGKSKQQGGAGSSGGYTCPMHPEVRSDTAGKCPKCGMDLVPAQEAAGAETAGQGGGMAGMGHRQMMMDMAMVTEQRNMAAAIGVAAAMALVVLVSLARWPLAAALPRGDAAMQVGQALLSRYMLAFEGAAYLILAGIIGAVVLGRREGDEHPSAAAHGAEQQHGAGTPPEQPPPATGAHHGAPGAERQPAKATAPEGHAHHDRHEGGRA